MTLVDWLRIGEFVIVVLTSVVVIARWSQKVETPNDSTTLIATVEKRVGVLEMRFERGNAEMSRLATTVQGWEQRARDVFPDKDACKYQMHESESDRKQLRDEIGRLWQHINGRGRAQ